MPVAVIIVIIIVAASMMMMWISRIIPPVGVGTMPVTVRRIPAPAYAKRAVPVPEGTTGPVIIIVPPRVVGRIKRIVIPGVPIERIVERITVKPVNAVSKTDLVAFVIVVDDRITTIFIFKIGCIGPHQFHVIHVIHVGVSVRTVGCENMVFPVVGIPYNQRR